MNKDIRIKFDLIENLFIGDPFSYENYTNSITLSCVPGKWEGILTLNDGVVSSIFLSKIEKDLDWEEERFIRDTKVLAVCQGEIRQKFIENKDDYEKVRRAAYISRQNPDYKTFYEFSKDIKGVPLQDLENMETITLEQAKQYYEFRSEYDSSEYSIQTKLYPFYYTFNGGLILVKDEKTTFKLSLGLTEDFKLGGISISLN